MHQAPDRKLRPTSYNNGEGASPTAVGGAGRYGDEAQRAGGLSSPLPRSPCSIRHASQNLATFIVVGEHIIHATHANINTKS